MRERNAAPLLVLLIALGGCATSSTGPAPFPLPTTAEPPGAEAPGPPTALPQAEAIVEIARSLAGAPYRAGGATPDGFDCSGFVHYVYREAGLPAPRTVRDLFLGSRALDDDQIRAGDLLFFRTSGHRISHVGIATGSGAFIHAPTSRGVVRVERFDDEYWARRFAGARRLTTRSSAQAGDRPVPHVGRANSRP